MRTADLHEVRQMVADGAQVVEVLGRDQYDWARLPGALHLPLAELGERATAELDARSPVAVYCNDFL